HLRSAQSTCCPAAGGPVEAALRLCVGPLLSERRPEPLMGAEHLDRTVAAGRTWSWRVWRPGADSGVCHGLLATHKLHYGVTRVQWAVIPLQRAGPAGSQSRHSGGSHTWREGS